jgi:hypothetical protein
LDYRKPRQDKTIKIKIKDLSFKSYDFFSNISNDDWTYVLNTLDTDVDEIVKSGVYEIINERIGELLMESRNE